jgi:hypothetical protein
MGIRKKKTIKRSERLKQLRNSALNQPYMLKDYKEEKSKSKHRYGLFVKK